MDFYIGLLIQLIVITSTGLFFASFTHKTLNNHLKVLGLSRFSFIVILGFSTWLLDNTPIFVSYFFALTTALCILVITSIQSHPDKQASFNFLGVSLPIGILILLINQPYMLSYVYDSLFLSGISILLGLLSLYYFKKHAFNNKFLSYVFIQILSLLLCSINLNNGTLIASCVIMLISDLLLLLVIHKEVNNVYSNVHHEVKYYKDQFDVAVEKEVKKRTFYMEQSKMKLAEMNRTDHLTKLLNRKSVVSEIEDMILDKNTSKFVLFVFDIDYFKKINDTQGHATGDACLRSLAGIMKSCSRDYDILGRYGGDEFIIVLPKVGYKEGISYGQKLMEEIRQNSNPKFSISLGMSVYPWDGENYKALFEVADKGLYLAKEEGRNRIGYKGYIKIE